MTDLSQFHISAADWREQLRKNKKRTRNVMMMFILLYVSLGFLVDMVLYTNEYPQAGLTVIAKALVTFQLFPYGTLTMSVVAAISIFVAYVMYDKIMLLGTDYHEITAESARNLQEKQLYHVVEEMKVAAGLKFMPRVFIIDANYMNAFASGYSEKSAMIAITRGLMEKLDRAEMQAVMAHELSHVRHQDIKLTLMASILSTIMLIIIDLLFYNMIYSRRRSRSEDNKFLIIIIILRYVLPIITSLLMLYLSRTREYMADAGCVELMRDNQPLGRALLKIHHDHQQNLDAYREAYGNTAHEDVRRAAYLYDPVSTGVEPVHSVFSLFSTHPGLEDRLKAIGIKSQNS